MLSYFEALARLAELMKDRASVTFDALRDLVSQVSIVDNAADSGATTILYSGRFPDGTQTGTSASELAASMGSKARII